MKVNKVESNFGKYAFTHEEKQGFGGNGFSQTLATIKERVEQEGIPSEPVFQTGATSFSQREWEMLLDSYEEVQEDLLEQLKFLQKRKEEEKEWN